MGASTFKKSAIGSNPKEAFASAKQEALHEDGHGGYTGSIAEKSEFIVISNEVFPSVREAIDFAESLIDEGDSRIDDKWGPAGCIKYKMKDDSLRYLFFGWASS